MKDSQTITTRRRNKNYNRKRVIRSFCDNKIKTQREKYGRMEVIKWNERIKTITHFWIVYVLFLLRNWCELILNRINIDMSRHKQEKTIASNSNNVILHSKQNSVTSNLVRKKFIMIFLPCTIFIQNPSNLSTRTHVYTYESRPFSQMCLMTLFRWPQFSNFIIECWAFRIVMVNRILLFSGGIKSFEHLCPELL